LVFSFFPVLYFHFPIPVLFSLPFAKISYNLSDTYAFKLRRQVSLNHKRMTDNFLSQLNPEQIKAVTYESGPLLVLAGAGSGKLKSSPTEPAGSLIKKKLNRKIYSS